MAVAKAAGEDIAMRRKRLRFRAWHRGTKEMDLVLGPFADANAEAMDQSELDRLEALMEQDDPELLKWIMMQEIPPPDVDRDLLRRIVADHQSRMSR